MIVRKRIFNDEPAEQRVYLQYSETQRSHLCGRNQLISREKRKLFLQMQIPKANVVTGTIKSFAAPDTKEAQILISFRHAVVPAANRLSAKVLHLL